jgi:hypothetical protein
LLRVSTLKEADGSAAKPTDANTIVQTNATATKIDVIFFILYLSSFTYKIKGALYYIIKHTFVFLHS